MKKFPGNFFLDNKEEVQKAKEIAFRFLARRDRSRKEVEAELGRKGVAVEVVLEVICFLQKKDYVNDEKVGYNILKNKVNSAPFGPLGLEHELKKRGFDSNTICTLSTLFWKEYNEEDLARSLVQVKLKSLSDTTSQKELHRVYGLLLRRGFSRPVSDEVIAEVAQWE